MCFSVKKGRPIPDGLLTSRIGQFPGMASRKAIARKKKSLLPGSRHATVVDISPTGELTVRLATGSLLVCDFSSSWTRFIFAILRSPGSTEPGLPSRSPRASGGVEASMSPRASSFRSWSTSTCALAVRPSCGRARAGRGREPTPTWMWTDDHTCQPSLPAGQTSSTEASVASVSLRDFPRYTTPGGR